MIINITDLENYLEKYLQAVEKEKIIITSNGRKVAKLSAYENLSDNVLANEVVEDKAYKSRKVTWEEFRVIWENTEDRYE